MKKLNWLVAAVLLLSAPNVNADCYDQCCDPCGFNCEDFDFSFYGQYLYWHVCRSDLDFYDDGDRDYINPDYHSGYRLGAHVGKDCWDLHVRYTSFDFCDTKDDDFKFDLDYDVVDIELGYAFHLNCPNVVFRPFAGAKLAWIDDKYDRDGDEDDQDFCGYGLYLGASADWHICDYDMCGHTTSISLVSRGDYAILDGHFKADRDGGDDREKSCQYIPVLEAFVGLNFGFTDCCGCFNGDLAIGYEVQHWGDWHQHHSDDDRATFGLGGLVVHLGLGF